MHWGRKDRDGRARGEGFLWRAACGRDVSSYSGIPPCEAVRGPHREHGVASMPEGQSDRWVDHVWQ